MTGIERIEAIEARMLAIESRVEAIESVLGLRLATLDMKLDRVLELLGDEVQN